MEKLTGSLLWAGLGLLAAGGLYYAGAVRQAEWGLVAAGAGLLVIILAALANRRALAQGLRRRSTRLGLGAVLASALVIAAALFLGALALRHDARFDFSKNARFSLAPQSVKVLKQLDTPVTAYAFFNPQQPERAAIENLLDRLAHQSREFRFQFVDPDQQPGVARRFGVGEYGVVVLEAKEKEETIKLPGEQTLINALIRLTRQGDKIIYFLTGHGEAQLADAGKDGLAGLKQALANQGYQAKEFTLATQPKVPANALALVIPGPRKPLMEPEKERIAAYLAAGGGVLLMLEPQDGTGLEEWLAQWGVVLGDDIVLDQASQLFGASPAWPLAAEYGQHVITDPLAGIHCFFPICRSVGLAPETPPGVSGVVLVKSSPESWAETDLGALGQGKAAYDVASDRKGPIGLAVALEIAGQKTKDDSKPARPGRLVVFGDASFAGNAYLDQAGNRDLALNSIDFLAGEEDLVSIRPKEPAHQPLLLQPQQAYVAMLVPMVVLPGLLLVIGIAVVIRRRKPA